MELDPFARPWAMGKILMQQRKLDEAISELRLRAEAQPHEANVHMMLYQAYRFKGMWKESLKEMQQAFTMTGRTQLVEESQRVFDKGGSKAVAEWRLEAAKKHASTNYISPMYLAFISAQAGHKEEALNFLEAAYAERSAWLVLIQGEPDFDFLHSDKRYQHLISKIGLPPAY